MSWIQKTGILVLILWAAGCSTPKKVVEIPEDLVDPEQIVGQVEGDQSEFQYVFVEGLKQKMLGNNQEAIKYFSTCLEMDPNSAVAMFELATIYAGNQDFTSAGLLLEKAIGISPENKWYKQMLAGIYQQSKKFEKAASIYNDLVVLEPENLDYMYMKALMYSAAGKRDEAIDAYRRLEDKVGINEQISVAVQELLVEDGKIKEAFREIEKLIASSPEESKYYGLLADLYMSQGETEKALENYNKILEMDPENGFVHFSLANYYLEKGDLAESFEHTKKGFASPEVDVDTKIQLYLVFTSGRSGNNISKENLGELVRVLVETNADDQRVYMVYAEYLLGINKLKEAREQLVKLTKMDNPDYLVWERLLFVNNDLQDWNSLYDDSEEAMFLYPNQPMIYFMHGIACIQLEKYQEAINICDEGRTYVINNPAMQGQMIMIQGEAYYKLDNRTKAFSLFDEALELDPNNFIAMNNYAYYLSLLGQDLDKAERMSGRVIEEFPDNSTYLDTHAWVLFKRKNYPLARFYMESAIKNGGQDNPVLLEHYGDILIMLNRTEEAREYWLKAKEKGSDSEVLDQKIRDLKYYENEEQ